MESNFILLLLVALCCGQPDHYLQTYPPIINSTDSRTPLTFALLMSFHGVITSGAVAGVQVALDTINNDPDFLPGYSLHYVLSDSRCNRTVSIEALFKQVSRGPNDSDDRVKLAVLGAGCSVATEPTAEISHFFNIPQLSCVSSSPELANRVKFKSYFQLLPTQAEIAPAFFGVIQEYGWKYVALIVQNENLFTVTADRVKTLLNTINVSYSENIFQSEEGIAGLGPEPFDPEARIFIIATYSNHAKPLLCEAYHRGIRYPQYLLLTLGWYADRWWEKESQNENLSCTSSERASVLRRSLALLYYDFPEHLNRSLATDVGINVSQYIDMEETHLTVNSLALQKLKASPYCHDTMWTLAYALKHTIQDLESNHTLSQLAWAAEGMSTNQTFQLENFTYNNDVIMNAMFGHLHQSHFIGLTGRVSFSSSGLRKASIRRVFQYRIKAEGTASVTGLERVNIAIVESALGDSENFNFEYLPNENDTVVWPDGIPYDGVPNEVVVSISVGLAAVFFVLATSGIVFALACIIFNFTYREKKLIRLSSYKMNYLIGIGAIVLYTDIILSVIPTTNPDVVAVLCTLTPWLTAIGHSLCYGTVVVKMWRVYFIFNNPTPNRKKALKDWMLALAVGVFVLIDITVLLVYTAVEGSRGNLRASKVPNRENREDIEGELAVITRYFIYLCDSPAHNALQGVLYGYKGVLQVMTLVLAFSTRKVKVKGLNDAKYILAAIYVSSIVLAVIIVSTYSLKDLINVFATVFSTGFFIGTTVILGLVFGPKMVGVYRDPDGETVFDRSDSTVLPTTTMANSDNDTLRRRVKELEAQVAKQQEIISSSADGLVHQSSQPELMNGYAVGEVTAWGTIV